MVWYIYDDDENYDENDKRPFSNRYEQKSIWFFQRWIRRKDYERICCALSKTICIQKGWWRWKEKSSRNKKVRNKTRAYVWNCKDCLFNAKVILKSQQRFKSDHHKVYTEEVNKIALSSDDDKKLQTFDGIETYPYGTTNEMLTVFESKENVLKIKND